MQDYEKLGVFYLGKPYDATNKKLKDEPILFDSKNFTTHAVILGMTGSGKTGLGIGILEEAAIDGIPALIIDPKGDLTNLLLTFPELKPEQFLPWIDVEDAERKGISKEVEAATVAKTWKDGLTQWGEEPSRIGKLKSSVDWSIYTPASNAGISLSILSTFTAPSQEVILDTSSFRDLILSTTSSLLGLIGIDADPVQSREHILISTIFDQAWRKGQNIDLPTLIQQVQKPPFSKIGVLDLETFYPNKERQNLALRLNNLLASPGFQAWMEGEPLDIQRLLYTADGKPRHAVLCIAHLQDSERMFFVTMLLNQLVSWMRRQSGTSSLRALLYMDEIYGYFPPTAMPPSKRPMLTLLKQARAFGLGIVLSTQNPVDLDYKGLANCGTWFIGKLLTDKDRSKVVEGLSTATNNDKQSEDIKSALTACGSRIFLLRSVHEDPLTLFQTRWTLSYLKGPLTLPQIQFLMDQKGRPDLTKEEIRSADVKPGIVQKPNLPPGIPEFYQNPINVSEKAVYLPRIFGLGKLHFVDAKSKIDVWKEFIWAAPVTSDGTTIQWDQAQSLGNTLDSLQKNPLNDSTFNELPGGLLNLKNYSEFTKSYANFLYQNQTYELFDAPELKILSKDNETEGDLRARISMAMREKRDQDVQKLRDTFQPKINSLMEKIRTAQAKLEDKQSQAGQKKLETFVSAGATLLGAFFGRGKITSGTISKAGSTLKSASRIGKGSQDVEQANQTVATYQGQLQSLEGELQSQIQQLQSTAEGSNIAVNKVVIHPRKSDISVISVGILWSTSGTQV